MASEKPKIRLTFNRISNNIRKTLGYVMDLTGVKIADATALNPDELQNLINAKSQDSASLLAYNHAFITLDNQYNIFTPVLDHRQYSWPMGNPTIAYPGYKYIEYPSKFVTAISNPVHYKVKIPCALRNVIDAGLILSDEMLNFRSNLFYAPDFSIAQSYIAFRNAHHWNIDMIATAPVSGETIYDAPMWSGQNAFRFRTPDYEFSTLWLQEYLGFKWTETSYITFGLIPDIRWFNDFFVDDAVLGSDNSQNQIPGDHNGVWYGNKNNKTQFFAGTKIETALLARDQPLFLAIKPNGLSTMEQYNKTWLIDESKHISGKMQNINIIEEQRDEYSKDLNNLASAVNQQIKYAKFKIICKQPIRGLAEESGDREGWSLYNSDEETQFSFTIFSDKIVIDQASYIRAWKGNEPHGEEHGKTTLAPYTKGPIYKTLGVVDTKNFINSDNIVEIGIFPFNGKIYLIGKNGMGAVPGISIIPYTMKFNKETWLPPPTSIGELDNWLIFAPDTYSDEATNGTEGYLEGNSGTTGTFGTEDGRFRAKEIQRVWGGTLVNTGLYLYGTGEVYFKLAPLKFRLYDGNPANISTGTSYQIPLGTVCPGYVPNNDFIETVNGIDYKFFSEYYDENQLKDRIVALIDYYNLRITPNDQDIHPRLLFRLLDNRYTNNVNMRAWLKSNRESSELTTNMFIDIKNEYMWPVCETNDDLIFMNLSNIHKYQRVYGASPNSAPYVYRTPAITAIRYDFAPTRRMLQTDEEYEESNIVVETDVSEYTERAYEAQEGGVISRDIELKIPMYMAFPYPLNRLNQKVKVQLGYDLANLSDRGYYYVDEVNVSRNANGERWMTLKARDGVKLLQNAKIWMARDYAWYCHPDIYKYCAEEAKDQTGWGMISTFAPYFHFQAIAHLAESADFLNRWSSPAPLWNPVISGELLYPDYGPGFTLPLGLNGTMGKGLNRLLINIPIGHKDEPGSRLPGKINDEGSPWKFSQGTSVWEAMMRIQKYSGWFLGFGRNSEKLIYEPRVGDQFADPATEPTFQPRAILVDRLITLDEIADVYANGQGRDYTSVGGGDYTTYTKVDDFKTMTAEEYGVAFFADPPPSNEETVIMARRLRAYNYFGCHCYFLYKIVDSNEEYQPILPYDNQNIGTRDDFVTRIIVIGRDTGNVNNKEGDKEYVTNNSGVNVLVGSSQQPETLKLIMNYFDAGARSVLQSAIIGLVVDTDLEARIGEVRPAMYKCPFLTTFEQVKKAATSIAKFVISEHHEYSFSVPKLSYLNMDIYDPIKFKYRMTVSDLTSEHPEFTTDRFVEKNYQLVGYEIRANSNTISGQMLLRQFRILPESMKYDGSILEMDANPYPDRPYTPYSVPTS